jgi:AraC family ethanolamine operon transcriptional activator
MMLQNPKRRIWSVSSVDFGEIDVQHGRLGSGNIAEAQLRSDGFMLYLPLTDACEYTANGTVLDKDTFAIFEPGSEICVSTQDEHDWLTVFIPTHLLGCDSDLEERLFCSEKRTVRVTRANPQFANRFRSVVGQIMTTADSDSQFESSLAAKCAATELLTAGSSVIGQSSAGNLNPKGRPRIPREEIIRRAKELLEQSDSERVLVEELAASAHVSKRTLRTAFNEYFGIGPIRYLQLRQLHRVRGALRAADSEAESVSGILIAYGEWEFGRFAARYRRQFGELPSETLRTKSV